MNKGLCLIVFLIICATTVHAQSSEEAVNAVGGFSTDLMKLLQGPVVKVLGAMVLLGGVAALLRGRQQIAVACAIAFTILLFLPSLISKVGIGAH